jgi:hypothetical protein
MSGKVAFLTGAGAGIARATARAFAREGAAKGSENQRRQQHSRRAKRANQGRRHAKNFNRASPSRHMKASQLVLRPSQRAPIDQRTRKSLDLRNARGSLLMSASAGLAPGWQSR